MNQSTQTSVAYSTSSTLRHGPRPNDLGLVQAVDGPGEGVVVRAADAADRAFDARCSETLGVANRRALRAAVAMVHEAVDIGPRVQRLLERIEREVALERARHPPADDATRETSTTNATYANPTQSRRALRRTRRPRVRARRPSRMRRGMSATQSWFGLVATSSRCTRSGGRNAFSSARGVTLNARSRVAPRRPMSRMTRSTVHRATSMFSRPSWRQTMSAPYMPWLSFHTRWMCGRSCSSRFARAGRRSGSSARRRCS